MPRFTYSNLEITGDVRGAFGQVIAPRVRRQRQTVVRELTVKGKASPQFSNSKNEGRARAFYAIPWSGGIRLGGGSRNNIDQAKRDFLGYSTPAVSEGAGVVGVSRVIPYPHPSFPNYLYAESIQQVEGWVPVGIDADQISLYDEAIVEVNFSTLPYQVGDDGLTFESSLNQYVTIESEPIGRVRGIPSAHALRWVNPDPQGNQLQPFSNTDVVFAMEAEVTIVWHQIPVAAIPWQFISQCINGSDSPGAFGVGNYRFLSSSYRGPVLQTSQGRTISKFICLTPKENKPYQMVTGEWAEDVVYKFLFKPFGSNFYYRWISGQWEQAASFTQQQVVINGNLGIPLPPIQIFNQGRPWHPEVDFTKLFWG